MPICGYGCRAEVSSGYTLLLLPTLFSETGPLSVNQRLTAQLERLASESWSVPVSASPGPSASPSAGASPRCVTRVFRPRLGSACVFSKRFTYGILIYRK